MQHHTTREEAMMITPTSTISPPDSPEDLHKKSRGPNPFSIDHILERDFSPPLPMGLQSPPLPLNSNSNHHQHHHHQNHLQNHQSNNNHNNNNNNNNNASSANMAAAAAAAAARLQSHMFHQSMMNQSSAAAMAAAAAAAGYQNPYAGHHHLGPQFAHLSAGLHRLLHLHPYRKPKRIRTAFSPGQLMELEKAFDKNHYVVGTERKQLAQRLNLTETQVKVWFQNRRTKHKRQKSDD